jgi:hypothetical protein
VTRERIRQIESQRRSRSYGTRHGHSAFATTWRSRARFPEGSLGVDDHHPMQGLASRVKGP